MPKNNDPDFPASNHENVCQLLQGPTCVNRIELIMQYVMVQDNHQHGYDS